MPRHPCLGSPVDDADLDMLNAVMQRVADATPRALHDRCSPHDTPKTAPLPTSGAGGALAGFLPGTRISTIAGDLPVESLRIGDEIRTASGALAAVLWIDRIQLDADYLARHRETQPVLIRAGALAPGLPRRDLMLAPDQPVCAHTPRLGGAATAAAEIRGRSGISRSRSVTTTYYRFHCGQPVTAFAEGAAVAIAQPQDARRAA